jgi:predicted RNA-binding protein YlqC (UPF0109 family)
MLNDKTNGTFTLKDHRDPEDLHEPCLDRTLVEADMATLLAAVVAKIVQNRDAANVSLARSSCTTVLDFDVASDDKAKVIGRGGQIIHALQVLARAMLGEYMQQHHVVINLVKGPYPDDQDDRGGYQDDRNSRSFRR